MVSFQCDGCADTVKKPKLDQHRQRCYASFTCLDCSTTFQNQDYKSHTSCVTEAEKYQGALYKGPKKGQNQPPVAAAVTQITTSEDNAAPSPTPSASASASTSQIHPSRLGQMGATTEEQPYGGPSGGRGRGGARGRGGRGGFGAPSRGGGYGGQNGYGQGGGQGQGQGYGDKSYASAMNKLALPGGMRSWGASAESTPVPDHQQQSPSATVTAPRQEQVAVPLPNGGGDKKATKKGKGKKGDKGGTGAKANSKRPKSADGGEAVAGANEGASSGVETPAAAATVTPTAPTLTEPKSKKRKFDESPAPAAVDAATEGSSSKSVKKLRKRYTKLAEKGGEMTLGSLVEALGKEGDSAEVLRNLKVVVKDGSFALSI